MKAIVCHAPEDLRLDTFDTDALGTHQLKSTSPMAAFVGLICITTTMVVLAQCVSKNLWCLGTKSQASCAS